MERYTKVIQISNLIHILVPKHEILSDEDKKELLSKLKAKENHFPTISPKDPALENMKPKKGDIIKITRDSQTAGVATYYRIVEE